MQSNLEIFIDKHSLIELGNVCTLIREGWNLIHFEKNETEIQTDKNTRIVLIRKFDTK